MEFDKVLDWAINTWPGRVVLGLSLIVSCTVCDNVLHFSTRINSNLPRNQNVSGQSLNNDALKTPTASDFSTTQPPHPSQTPDLMELLARIPTPVNPDISTGPNRLSTQPPKFDWKPSATNPGDCGSIQKYLTAQNEGKPVWFKKGDNLNKSGGAICDPKGSSQWIGPTGEILGTTVKNPLQSQ